MFLAALHNELETAVAIQIDVLRGDALGRAVHDDIGLAEQLTAGDMRLTTEAGVITSLTDARGNVITVGTGYTDLAGNAMDQNRNGVLGEIPGAVMIGSSGTK